MGRVLVPAVLNHAQARINYGTGTAFFSFLRAVPVPWTHGFEPHPPLIVLSFPQNSSKTVRHSYQFETVPEPCMRAAKQLAVLVFWYLPGYYYRYSCTAVARSSTSYYLVPYPYWYGQNR